MQLYYKPGACSLASHILLRETEERFELVKVDTESGQTESGDAYRDVNARGYVPALRLGSGDVLTESLSILQYIADQAPHTALAPTAGTVKRARLEEVLSFLASEVHKAFSPFFSGVTLGEAGAEPHEAKLRNRLGLLAGFMADGRPYLLGEQYSLADAYAFTVLNWAGFIGLNLADWPALAGLHGRVSERPAVQAALKAEGLVQ